MRPTQEQRKKVIELRNEGKNFQEIAILTNIDHCKIRYIFNDDKVEQDKTRNKDLYFSSEDIEFLKENYSIHGCIFCAEHLNKKIDAVFYKARQLKLKRFNKNDNAPEGFAWCAVCKRYVKDEFISKYKSNRGVVGKRNICKSCGNAQRNSFMDAKRSNPKYRREEMIKTIVKSKRRAAKLKNMSFDLDYEWVDKNLIKQCPILNKDFEFPDKKTGSYSNYAVSVDRIDNNKGYTKNNCILVCRRANMIKNDASPDELMIIAKFYKNLEEERSQIEYYI
jgi:hypothetical protein